MDTDAGHEGEEDGCGGLRGSSLCWRRLGEGASMAMLSWSSGGN